MITPRFGIERGHFDHGWLRTYHTFSFGDYLDPKFMGFRSLRVINEDFIEPSEGFPTHSHRDMEIITYVLEGELEHKDSMGNGSVIRSGEVQKMSAGTGVTHSEYNHSKKGRTHLYQVWILPAKKGIRPGYEQRSFKKEDRENRFVLAASGRGEPSVITIEQDAAFWLGACGKGKKLEYPLAAGRHGWVQMARGECLVNGLTTLRAGDGASAMNEEGLRFEAREDSELLLFDLG